MMSLWQEWWVWIFAGVALAVLEVIVPGYVFLGFAIGTALTGALLFLGVAGPSLPMLILIAAVLSLVAWLALRRVFRLRGGNAKVWDRDINDEP